MDVQRADGGWDVVPEEDRMEVVMRKGRRLVR